MRENQAGECDANHRRSSITAVQCISKEGVAMRFRVALIVVVAAIVFILTGSVRSQNPERTPDVPQFNAKQEVKLTGQIYEVKDFDCPVTGTVGTHLELKTSSGPIEVHVAAARFLQQYGIHFEPGQTVEMTGVKGTYQGRAAFLPRIILVGK